jgi:hypothetical protein
MIKNTNKKHQITREKRKRIIWKKIKRKKIKHTEMEKKEERKAREKLKMCGTERRNQDIARKYFRMKNRRLLFLNTKQKGIPHVRVM